MRRNFLTGKAKKKKGSNKKELNKKGQEKEGSDMDIFTKIEQPTTLPEKSVRAEKGSQSNSQPTVNANNTNNRSKINSSQKSVSIFLIVKSPHALCYSMITLDNDASNPRR